MPDAHRPTYQLVRLASVIRSSMWFVPTVMVAAGAGLALGTIALDEAVGGAQGLSLGVFYLRDPAGARAVLATIAGSMITVAGVTFSITVAVLALAAQQYGPRLVGNFMRDRGNQVVLGSFLAVFLFCLLVMLEVGYEPDPFVPAISTLTGVFLAILDLGMLVYFIHHVADSIQADRILRRLGHELDRTIRGITSDQPPPLCGPHLPADPGVAIEAERRGYVQAVDEDAIVQEARRIGALVVLANDRGAYLIEGDLVARVHGTTEIDEETSRRVRGAVYVGALRTTEEDLAYGIEQVVELAVRSLSPGINDPFTAERCIDRLTAALAVIAGRHFPPPCRHDEAGEPRLVTPGGSFEDAVALSFDRVRHAGASHPALVAHLLASIAHLVERARSLQQVAALRQQADAAVAEALAAAATDRDRRRIEAAHGAVLRAAAAHATAPGG